MQQSSKRKIKNNYSSELGGYCVTYSLKSLH